MALSFLGKYKDFGLFLLRIGVGTGFVLIYGWPKISGGPDFWLKLGGAMVTFGIHFAPTAWGFISALTEFGGGLLLTLGLFTRPAAFFMAVNMIVAASSTLSHHDPWFTVIHPI